MSTISTKDAIVYLQGSGAAAVVLSEASEVMFDLDYDTEPDVAFGDSWETKLKGIHRWSGSIGGNFDTAQSLLFDAATQTSSRKLYVYPDRATATRYYYGNVWPRLSPNMPYGVAKFTARFDGDGQLALQ